MSKLIGNISKFTILVLGIISVILVALIYFGGNAESLIVGEDSLTVPKFTDTLIYWCYILIALTICITYMIELRPLPRKLRIRNRTSLI